MTTIAVKRDESGIRIAADRQVTQGTYSESTTEKVFARKGITFCGAGDLRALDIVQYAMKIPQFRDIDYRNANKWLVKHLVPALRKAFSDEEVDLHLLVITPDNTVRYICSDFSLTGLNQSAWALGSGTKFALGALAAGASAVEAVKVAARFDVYTGADIDEWLVEPYVGLT